MVKRFREDGVAAGRMRYLLAEIKKLEARDTAKDSRDLLKDAVLLVREEDPEADGDDNAVDNAHDGTDDELEVQVQGNRTLSVSKFLRSQLPQYKRHIVNRIVDKLRSPFARKLSAAKQAELRSQNKRAVAHVNVNKPSITYVECDQPLMQRILGEMGNSVKAATHNVFMEAQETVTTLGQEVGLVF